MDNTSLTQLEQTLANNLASLDANIAERQRELATHQTRVRELTEEIRHLSGAREWHVNIVVPQLQRAREQAAKNQSDTPVNP